MKDGGTDQLKRVIETQHGGIATLSQSFRLIPQVPNASPSQYDWDGIVHVFDLKDNPKAKRAYAWASPIQGGSKPRFFAVLHQGRVTDPVEAVKAAAAAIRRAGA
jgi:hypothetical protein